MDSNQHHPKPTLATSKYKFEPAKKRFSSVFDKSSDTKDVAGSLLCPQCGQALGYLFSQIGSKVTCPGCGEHGIRIGQSLMDASTVQEVVLEPAYSVLLFKNSWFGRHLLVTLALVIICLVSLSAGWAVTRSDSQYTDWLKWEAEAVEEGKTPTGTQEGSQNAPLPPPDITLVAIEALLEESDAHKALVQAQMWQQMLRDYGIAETDPRLQRLEEIIAALREKTKPAVKPPPPHLAEFRQLLEELRQAVSKEDLPAARAALERAQNLFDAHAEDLAIYGRSFLAIKHRFEQLALAQEGRAKIAELLGNAESLIKGEKPLEAAEALAQAMFLALRTTLEQSEWEESDRTVRRLEKELRFARGKRAVEQAEECDKQGDLDARERQLSMAFELLPDLPSERVSELLATAREISTRKIASPKPSALGRELEFVAAYEDTLRYYGRREMMVELAQHCVELEQLLRKSASTDVEKSGRVADLILGTLEFEVGDLLSISGRSSEVAASLALAQKALDLATPWKKTPRWQAVDGALRSKGDEVASGAIKAATKRAGEGDLSAALTEVEPARHLGSADTRAKADRLFKQWEIEFETQKRLISQEQDWQEMITLYGQGKVLEVWQRLREFEKAYPNSTRAKQLGEVKRKLQPKVESAILVLFQDVGRHYVAKNWQKFRLDAELLEQVLITDEHQVRFERIKESLNNLSGEAEKKFLVAEKNRTMINDKVVVTLLAQLDEVLQLDPHHAKAMALQKLALERARKMAEGFLLQARQAGPNSPGPYVEKLERVIKLDPDGKLGTEAKELLEDFKKSAKDP